VVDVTTSEIRNDLMLCLNKDEISKNVFLFAISSASPPTQHPFSKYSFLVCHHALCTGIQIFSGMVRTICYLLWIKYPYPTRSPSIHEHNTFQMKGILQKKPHTRMLYFKK
jgi:hypothetical protein